MLVKTTVLGQIYFIFSTFPLCYLSLLSISARKFRFSRNYIVSKIELCWASPEQSYIWLSSTYTLIYISDMYSNLLAISSLERNSINQIKQPYGHTQVKRLSIWRVTICLKIVRFKPTHKRMMPSIFAKNNKIASFHWNKKINLI